MPLPSRRTSYAVVLCAVVVVGCGSDKNSGPAATGSLTVTVNTSGDGVPGAVVVSGPNGYTTTVTATQTLTALVAGSYSLVADSSTAPDSVVGTVTDTGNVTGSPATVVAHATATATATYAVKTRIGGLWLANNDYGTLPEYSGIQLRTSATPTPFDTLSTPLSGPAGLALDATGNMWESTYHGDSLVMYSPTARNGGAATAPTTVLTSSAIVDGENLAFDPQGNLWLADCNGNTLLEFTPSQLTAGGAQTPSVVITSASLTCPWTLAFDGSGNMWVGDDDRTHIVEFSAAQITITGLLTPVDTIGENSGSPNDVVGMAFDASGNLWLANEGSTKVTEYTPTQLAASGSPVPTTVISVSGAADLFGAAFDHRGTFWVTDDGNNSVYGITAAQLAAGGTITPAVVIGGQGLGGGDSPEQPLFDATAPSGLSASRLRASSVPVRTGAHHFNPNRRHYKQ